MDTISNLNDTSFTAPQGGQAAPSWSEQLIDPAISALIASALIAGVAWRLSSAKAPVKVWAARAVLTLMLAFVIGLALLPADIWYPRHGFGIFVPQAAVLIVAFAVVLLIEWAATALVDRPR